MKKYLFIIILALFIIIPSVALASDQARIDSLKERATGEIDRRVTDLTDLVTIMSSLKQLTADQKTVSTTQIKKNISDLGAVKTKITNDTGLGDLRVDVQPIVTSYQIYLVFMSKIHLIAAADMASDITDSLNAIAVKLQTRVSLAEQNGQNMDETKKSLVQMQTDIQSAQDKIKIVVDLASGLVPENYPANKGVIQSAGQALIDARASLSAARADAVNTWAQFKGVSPAPTATP